MNAEIKNENFTHCKCQNCGFFGMDIKFNPRTVPLSETNLPNMKFTITQGSIDTINYNCPICDSPFVEPYFLSEQQ